MFSIYVGPPGLLRTSLACISTATAITSAKEHPEKKPAVRSRELTILDSTDNTFPASQVWIFSYKLILPNKNVVLCFSLLDFGLKMLIPFLWFPFAKCLTKAASTLSMSLVTCIGTFWDENRKKGGKDSVQSTTHSSKYDEIFVLPLQNSPDKKRPPCLGKLSMHSVKWSAVNTNWYNGIKTCS